MPNSFVKNLEEYVSTGASLVIDKDFGPTGEDVELAVFLLLGEISDADKELGVAEVREIYDVMSQQFGTSEARLVELSKLAHTVSSDSKRREELLDLLCDRFTKEQRIKVLSLVWRVILADGIIKESETHRADELAARLRLGDEDVAKARSLATEQVVPEGVKIVEE